MSSYVVLARKWRPAQFSDIVGQSHIVRTLTNAIRLQRIHHAYLFTGSRGIGKTSIARIFAKVLRCEKAQGDPISDTEIRSCDQCASCLEITAGNSVDVNEIDGASNNGVEAVREIRENAKYMPATGTRKIYIIDEVHMLTTAAFNALLKTLEEPPAHVVFIFATTEPHKIPATILSRCQRFDYRRVTLSQIQTRLEEISRAEGIQTEIGALSLIARAGEGSMRDALSLLDQVIAFSGQSVSIQSVRESIGLIGGQVLIGIITAIFQRKPLNALHWINEAYQQGHDLRVLTRSLTEFLHAVLLIHVNAPLSSTNAISEEEWKELQAIAPSRTIEEIELIFQVLHHGLEWIARSPQPKTVLDVLVIKCATAEALICTTPNGAEAPSFSPVTSAIPVSAPKVSAPTNTNTTAPPVPLQTAASTSTSTKTWEGLIDHIRKSRPLLASILEHATNNRLPQFQNSDKTLFICFSPQEAYFREQLQSRVYQEQLSQLSKEFFGTPVRLQIDLRDAGESVAARKDREQKERVASIREQAQNHPIIQEAKSLFGGELGPIAIRENHANLST